MGAVIPKDCAGKPDCCGWKDKFLFLFLKYYLFLHSTESAFAPLYRGDGGYFLEESSKSNISVRSNLNDVVFSTERVSQRENAALWSESQDVAQHPMLKVLGPNLHADPRPS